MWHILNLSDLVLSYNSYTFCAKFGSLIHAPYAIKFED